MNDSPRWFLHNSGRRLGPYTRTQLEWLRDQKRLGPTTEVSTDGREWRLALTISGLFTAVAGSAELLEAILVPQPAAPPLRRSPPPAPYEGAAPPLPPLAEPVSVVRRGQSGANTALIVLGIVGGVLFVVLAAVAALFVMSRDVSRAGDSLNDLNRIIGEGGGDLGQDAPLPDRPITLPGRKLTVEEVVASCGPSVCIIRGRLGHGSGFVVAPGVVATNYHVVEPQLGGTIQVSFPSAPGGQRGPVAARFLHGNKARDLAFLSTPTRLPALQLAANYRFRSGQEISIIGSPGVGNVELLQNAVTRGLMSTSLTDGDLTLYQLDASVNPGNSGGPVFDETGHVVGVVTARAKKEERLAFCVSVINLRDELRRGKVGSR